MMELVSSRRREKRDRKPLEVVVFNYLIHFYIDHFEVTWACQNDLGKFPLIIFCNEPLEMNRNFWEKILQNPIIKMNSKSIRELRSIATDKGLRGYYKLKKADLIALLLEQSTEEMPTPPPRGSMTGPHDNAKKILKGDVESEAKNENHEDIDLTLHENERTFKGAFKSFLIPGTPKTGIDSYFDQTKPHIRT